MRCVLQLLFYTSRDHYIVVFTYKHVLVFQETTILPENDILHHYSPFEFVHTFMPCGKNSLRLKSPSIFTSVTPLSGFLKSNSNTFPPFPSFCFPGRTTPCQLQIMVRESIVSLKKIIFLNNIAIFHH